MNFTKAARTAAIATAATLNALAILAFAPKNYRSQEIARAKRNVAERLAQLAARLRAPIATAPIPALAPATKTAPAPSVTDSPIATPAPALPDPWTIAATPTAPTAPASIEPPATKTQLCLPPAPEPAPTAPAPKPKRAIAPKNLSKLTIRELKAIASKRKIRGAAKMNKSQLIAALA